jgi:apolipoprotein N-acyltransferase
VVRASLRLAARTHNLLLVAASVLLTVLAYPPSALWPVGWVMLVPLFVAVERSSPARAALLVYVYSAARGLVIVRWLVHALATEYEVPTLAAWLFTCLLVGAYVCLPASAAFVYRQVRPRVGAGAAPLVLGALWCLAEWLRAVPGGLPWVLVAHALAPVPLAYQVADLGGVSLVGFVVVCANAAMAGALVRRSPRPLWGAGSLVALTLAYGTWQLQRTEAPEPSLRVGVVQAALPPSERFKPGSAERNVRRHLELTRELARERPDLVVWSETAVDTDLDQAPGIVEALADLARDTSIPIVSGAPRSLGGRRTNSVVLVTPEAGLVGSYDKQRLVPFSEYDPPLFSWLAPLLGAVTQGDPYVAGESRVLDGGPVALATPVCFEITYPDLLRGLQAEGAELVLNLSNDAWFGRTGYAALHFLHARFRAVELRTWVVRAANTGISGIVDPRGRVVASLPVFAEGTLHAEVGPALGPTVYARFGDAPMLLLLGTVVLVATRTRRGG